MTKEEKQIYTRRITQGNKSDIIVVLFDIYMTYSDDARKALEAGDVGAFYGAVHNAAEVVRHLKSDLDFNYDISYELYALYDYVQRALAKSCYGRKAEEIVNALKVMTSLREAFSEVAKADTSGRQMKNTQTVVAGYTYGRESLNEVTDSCNRGFFA